MKSMIKFFIIAMILSACSGVTIGNDVQTEITQHPSSQPSDNSTLQSTTPATAPTTAVTQSFVLPSSTPQIPTPTSTPPLIATQTLTVTVVTDVASKPLAGSAILADYTIIDKFESIPSSALTAATAIKTLFMHQSTGGYIHLEGLYCLAGLHDDPNNYPQECIAYAQNPYSPYDNRQWTWKEWDTPMANGIAKTDTWVSVVNSQQQYYQVLGMKFCYVDGWNLDFDYYRQKMEELERTYPQKKFIWATSALWSGSAVSNDPNLVVSAENIQSFNQQLRAYAIANNKILYDLAAIESHDPNGNLCQSNSFEALCNEYYGDSGGHPNIIGSIRLAKGFWWLMARIGGWNGN